MNILFYIYKTSKQAKPTYAVGNQDSGCLWEGQVGGDTWKAAGYASQEPVVFCLDLGVGYTDEHVSSTYDMCPFLHVYARYAHTRSAL